MPQPLPISKRKTQNHLTTNKNINKHRTNMFVFMSKKKKKSHFCLLPTPFVLFDVVHRRLHKKGQKMRQSIINQAFLHQENFLTEKMFLFQKRFAIAINLLRRQFYLKTFRASRITTIPNLDLTYLDTSLFFLLLSFC